MAERHLILCDGLPRASAPRAWWRAHQVPLEIGSGDDVHLALNQLTDRMCASAPDIAIDLLELAAFVYAADQAVTRGGTTKIDYGDDWRRHFRFEVPVRCLRVWTRPDVLQELAGALEFLTDDVYEFAFHRAESPRGSSSYLFDGSRGTKFDEVVLFSGGLDSLCGAVEEVLHKRRRVLLVSHRSATRVFARQQNLVAALRELAPAGREPAHVPVTINKGEEHNRDFTQRSRSFVFAAVAAVVARLSSRNRIRFYENGVTSLNLPVSPELVGARASRTTHPQSLTRFGRLFSLLFDAEFAVENPYQWRTKAEVLAELRQQGHADLAARTCSCVHVWGMEELCPHCGRCSQCVDRRLSALAADLSNADDPPSRYASDPLAGEREGPDLTFAERYVGVAREITGLTTPRAFAVRFPEVNAALVYAGCPPEEAMRRSHDLYRRHAEGVECGLGRAFTRVGVFDWRTFPPHSLLGVVQGRVAHPSPAPVAVTPERGLVVDEERLEVRLDGRSCFLGSTHEFRVMQHLARSSPGRFVPVQELIDEVWGGAKRTQNAVQQVVSNLRREFQQSGLTRIEIDGSQPGYYCLVVRSE